MGLNPETVRKALREFDRPPESFLPKTNQEQRVEIVKRKTAGETTRSIAKSLGISQATVMKYHLAAGGQGGPRKLTEKENVEIVEALKDGASSRDLAKQYGIHISTISNVWKRVTKTPLEKTRITEKQEKEITRRFNLGETISPIARSLGLDRASKAMEALCKRLEETRSVTPAQRNEVVRLLANGMPVGGVATTIKLEPELVQAIRSQIILQNGVTDVAKEPETKSYDLLAKGYSAVAVATQLGFSVKLVRRVNDSLLTTYQLTDESKAQIQQAADEGKSAQTIARSLEVPLIVVNRALGRYDDRYKSGRIATSKQRADAVEACGKGETFAEVAERLNVTEAAVKRWYGEAIKAGAIVRYTELTRSEDFAFLWVTRLDPELEDWRKLLSDWFQSNVNGADQTMNAVSAFIKRYLIAYGLPKDPKEFLLRGKVLPDFYKTACPQSWAGKGYVTKIYEFIEWVLDTDEFADVSSNPPVRLVHQFRNPIGKPKPGEFQRNDESVKTVMPYWIIDDLRHRIVQGKDFMDWEWVRGLMPNACWFEVSEDKIDLSDRDCVWRHRERDKGGPVLEMWSPVRWVAHLIHLQTTPRSGQVRALDSGEADTFIRVKGKWILNKSPLAQGTPRKPRQQGAIRRPTPAEEELGAKVVMYFNTNKTADIGKYGTDKGFVCAWPELPNIWEDPYYWLEKLRDWQMKYNPIKKLTRWVDIDAQRALSVKSKAKGDEYPDAAFLFRTPELEGEGPISGGQLEHAWMRLLAEEEACLEKDGHRLPDGEKIELVNPETGRPWSTPHATRVSLITHMILDGDVPPEIMMKIVGHARFIMTIYYTKPGLKRIQDAIANAALKLDSTKDATMIRDLKGLQAEQLRSRVVFNTEDWTSVIPANPADRSPVGWLMMHDGVCLAGGNSDNPILPGCHNGGPVLRSAGADQAKWIYGPTPGGVRNCSRCRWKCAGRQHALGLAATLNNRQYHLHKASEAAISAERERNNLKKEKARVEADALPFMNGSKLRAVERRYEMAMQKMNEYALDIAAINRTIERIADLPEDTDSATSLAAQGDLLTLNAVIEETDSEALVLAGIVSDVQLFPDLDPGVAVFEFAQLLDAAFEREGKPPVLARLSEPEKLRAANAMMRALELAANPVNPILGRRKVVEIMDRKESLEMLLGVKLQSIQKLSGQAEQKPVTLSLAQKDGTHGN